MLHKLMFTIGALTGTAHSLDMATTWELFKPWKYPQVDNGQDNAKLELELKFQQFTVQFGKQYQTKEEREYRMQLFAEVDEYITLWNWQEGKTHTLGHNEFSDWSKDERAMLRGFRPNSTANVKATFSAPKDADVPDSVDWRTKGAVNPVQNQGRCGSCWAFSAIGAMEGAHYVKTGELIKLSEQQCVDCDQDSKGCNGGLQASCFEYAELDAMVTEKVYPYEGFTDTCFAPYNGTIKVNRYTNVERGNVASLKTAIAQQPVAVTVDAGGYPFQHYMSGIITDVTCGTSLDHAILAVGYGTENGTDYYIVKNSWGNKWGEEGYVRIAAVEGEGICGIQMMSLFPDTN